ncbi:MAG: YCF48-related protein [Bacteroidota bacterium]
MKLMNLVAAALAWGILPAGILSSQGWTPQQAGTTLTLYEVLMTDGSAGTAVGQAGKVLTTTDGGASWVAQPSGTATDLHGVDYYDTDSGIAVGNSGLMLRTTTGGRSWTVIPPVTTDNLRGISFADQLVGMVVGTAGTVLRSTNAGGTWIPLRGVAGTLYEVDFPDPQTGTVVGAQGAILKTTTGGVSWTPQTSGTTVTLLGVSFADSEHGIVVGHLGKILSTTNGGSTWTARPGGTLLNLTSVTMEGLQTAYAVGDSGLILKTTDGGTSWARQASGTTQTLNEVSFSDPLSGTIVGNGGTILRTTTGGGQGTVTRSYLFAAEWNLVSVPLSVADYRRGSLFPTAASLAFAYDPDAGYIARDTLRNGAGYWLKFDAPQSVNMTGAERLRDTLSVRAGWNIIGSVSGPVAVSQIQTLPAGIIGSMFYGFNGGYFEASVIEPGKGYWVKAEQNGSLILSVSPSAGRAAPGGDMEGDTPYAHMRGDSTP